MSSMQHWPKPMPSGRPPRAEAPPTSQPLHSPQKHRRAPVGFAERTSRCDDGRPSACHGCAVACIGQPPPPSAPGPVWGWAGMAALPRLRWPGSCPVHGAGVMPKISSRGCAASWAFSAESGGLAYQLADPSADGLALRRSIALQPLCPLLSAFVLVEYGLRQRPRAHRLRHLSESAILGQLAPFVCSVAHEIVLCCGGPGRCIAFPWPPAAAGVGPSLGRHRCRWWP